MILVAAYVHDVSKSYAFIGTISQISEANIVSRYKTEGRPLTPS